MPFRARFESQCAALSPFVTPCLRLLPITVDSMHAAAPVAQCTAGRHTCPEVCPSVRHLSRMRAITASPRMASFICRRTAGAAPARWTPCRPSLPAARSLKQQTIVSGDWCGEPGEIFDSQRVVQKAHSPEKKIIKIAKKQHLRHYFCGCRRIALYSRWPAPLARDAPRRSVCGALLRIAAP